MQKKAFLETWIKSTSKLSKKLLSFVDISNIMMFWSDNCIFKKNIFGPLSIPEGR